MSKMIIVEGNSNDKDNTRVFMVKGEKGEQGDLNHNDIVDNLTSTATNKVLSANQGKVLKDLVDTNITNISTNATNINNETIARQNADSDLQSQITGLASGSPLVANSVSEMTDTSRIYVNTSDGKWYYYNGSEWIEGGTYQATSIADNSINKNNLDEELQNAIFKSIGTRQQIDNASVEQFLKRYDGNYFYYSDNVKSLVLEIQPNTTYIVEKVLSSRFALYSSVYYPANNVAITNTIQDNTATSLEITTGSSDNYLTILFWYTSDTLTEEQIKNSIKVYKNEVKETLSQAEYLDEKIDGIVLSNKYINLFSYRPLGTLQKGYIAISCDDGGHSLANTTIPILKGYKTTYNKNIPVTFGLMTNSEVFTNNNEKTLVQEMLSDYGCSVAIHGTNSYTTYSEEGLYDFLNTQKTQLTTLCNQAPTSIIYPNHDYNTKTSTISGSFFGVCTTGGVNTPITYNGNSKLAGSRSNMYTLYRFSLFNTSVTTTMIKNAIDYAYDNNMIFLPFFHDITLTNDYERCKALLDYCVDYANQKGLTFINIGDIPNII